MLIVDKHCIDVCCDEFPLPQLIAMLNKYKNSDMENCICNQYRKKLGIVNIENMKFMDE